VTDTGVRRWVLAAFTPTLSRKREREWRPPLPAPHKLIRHARRLRVDATDAERKLWHLLRRRELAGWKFRRQRPVDRYIADFACVEAKLIVELDGGQHADNAADQLRTRRLETLGWRVMRFWNPDVLTNSEGVLTMILDALEQRESSLSRLRERDRG
jgi:very-short-patch-repair endonuclease